MHRAAHRIPGAAALASAAASLTLVICPPTGAFADEAATLKVGEFSFSASGAWKAKTKPRAMSKGGFTFTPSDGGLVAVDADFYHFGPGQGGGIEANVRRWKGQFDSSGAAPEAKDETLKFGGHTVTLVQVKGTYLEGGPFQKEKTKRPGYSLLGAILPSDGGAVFVKMTGPEKSVEAATDAFKDLLASAFK